MEKKLPISAIVVCYNEAKILESCLKSLMFCDEIILVNLESEDNTKEIGQKYGAKILDFKKEPIVEVSQYQAKDRAINDWLLFIDPDEVIDKNLSFQIQNIFPCLGFSVGAINVPWIFYFKNKRLKGTRWGGFEKKKTLIINKKKADFSQDSQRGRKVKKEFKELNLQFENNNCLHHYWMSSYSQLLEKHSRYILKEGESRYNNGIRTSFLQLIKNPLSNFIQCYFVHKGYVEGLKGFILSLIWVWYDLFSTIELLKYQKRKENYGAKKPS